MSHNNGDMELVPQEPLELMPGTPEALEPDALVDVEGLDYLHRRIYDTQERVLNGFVQYGTLLKATEAAGCNQDCVYQWRKIDQLCWNERYERALHRRREYAEAKYILHPLDNPKGNYGTDVLRIAYMNRLDPEHWNRGVRVTVEAPNELIRQLRALQELGKPEAESPKVVEGRALPWED